MTHRRWMAQQDGDLPQVPVADDLRFPRGRHALAEERGVLPEGFEDPLLVVTEGVGHQERRSLKLIHEVHQGVRLLVVEVSPGPLAAVVVARPVRDL